MYSVNTQSIVPTLPVILSLVRSLKLRIASTLAGILNTRFTVRDHARRRSRAVCWVGGYCSTCTFLSSTSRFLHITRYFFSCGRTEISFLARTRTISLVFSLLRHVITGCWNKHDGHGCNKGYVHRSERIFKLDSFMSFFETTLVGR